jgi:hypothetical protein
VSTGHASFNFATTDTCRYNGALEQCPKSKPEVRVALFRKLCVINVVLSRVDDAVRNLSKAVSLHLQFHYALPSTEGSPPQAFNAWMHSPDVQVPSQIDSLLPQSLKDLTYRIKSKLATSQVNPDYNLSKISRSIGSSTLHVDAASYTSNTTVQHTQHHGRGLFAKRALRMGELIMAEKAFALPGYPFDDHNSQCSLYSLGDGTTSDRAGALLFKELVHKLNHNSSVRSAFFVLDDGGYWEENGWVIEDDENIPVDV